MTTDRCLALNASDTGACSEPERSLLWGYKVLLRSEKIVLPPLPHCVKQF